MTIDPNPASVIGPMNRLTMFQVPLRLRSMTERHPLSEICDGRAGNWPPALLIRKSTRPSSA